MRHDLSQIKEAWSVAEVLQLEGIPTTKHPRIRCPLCEQPRSSLSPSFSYTERGFYCFRCGEHGNVIDLCMKLGGRTFLEAVNALGSRCLGVAPGKKARSPWAELEDLKEKWVEEMARLDREHEEALHVIKQKERFRVVDEMDGAMLRDLARVKWDREVEAREEERTAALFYTKQRIKEEVEAKKEETPCPKTKALASVSDVMEYLETIS